MKVTQWLVAATLLFTVGGIAHAQRGPVTLPDKGTTEYNINGVIGFGSDQGWQFNARWAPFINKNLQWGIDLNVQDGPLISTSGFVGALVNWNFPNEGSAVLPYIGVGLSGAYGDFSGSVWDIHAGLKYFVSSDVAITGEYQHLEFSDRIAGSGDKNADQIVLGVSVFR